MPSHITHHLFARRVLKGAMRENEFRKTIEKFDPYINFGAQGPDIFLHNRKRSPAAFKYGTSLHKKGYGTFCGNLLRGEAKINAENIINESFVYVLAFISHGILDRYTHPFINYFSGWVVQGERESLRYFRLHPFFERIIDVLILKEMEGTTICDYDFFNSIFLGENIPNVLLTLLSEGIKATYSVKDQHDIVTRVKNGYWDAIDLYRFTNPKDQEMKQLAYRREKTGESRKRILALFHPCELPRNIDFLNNTHKLWRSPFPPYAEQRDSFMDMFTMALQDATTLVHEVIVARERGLSCEDEIARTLGDENLSDGKREGISPANYSAPLPLEGVLQEIYKKLEAQD